VGLNSGPRVVVLGGGISGLAAAWRLSLARPDARITVVEASARPGGKLVTWEQDGFLIEGAADGFLARKPPAVDWAQELGLGPEIIEPRPEHRSSHILWDGQLHPLPAGFSGLVPGDPDALRRSALLTPAGATRAAAEADQPLRTEGTEESVAQCFGRRYGTEAFDRLMEPLLAGIYAGDANHLSADAAFPQLTRAERAGQPLTGTGTTASTGPAFRSFAGGMARFPGALVRRLAEAGVAVVTGRPVTAVERPAAGFVIRTAAGAFEADAVISALPPRSAGAVLAGLSPDLAGVLTGWPTASVANLNLGFDEAEVPHLPSGSGFVCPRAGATAFSAATWSSRKWPHRAPSGQVLVRVYFGGARDPEGWSRDDTELIDQALGLLATFHGGRRPRPLFHRAFRWKDGFAQPNLGHAARHARLNDLAVPGLVLAGGYFAGVGIPDCLARAEEAARLTADHLTATPKGVLR